MCDDRLHVDAGSLCDSVEGEIVDTRCREFGHGGRPNGCVRLAVGLSHTAIKAEFHAPEPDAAT